MADIGPGLRLHNVTTPTEEKAVVVLLHGFPQTWWQWRHVIPVLAGAGFRVVAPDYRGAGYSQRPLDGYDKRTMAGDIQGLLREHLGINGRLIMVGHDIGLMIAYAYAQAYRDEISDLVVMGAPAIRELGHRPSCPGWSRLAARHGDGRVHRVRRTVGHLPGSSGVRLRAAGLHPLWVGRGREYVHVPPCGRRTSPSRRGAAADGRPIAEVRRLRGYGHGSRRSCVGFPPGTATHREARSRPSIGPLLAGCVLLGLAVTIGVFAVESGLGLHRPSQIRST